MHTVSTGRFSTVVLELVLWRISPSSGSKCSSFLMTKLFLASPGRMAYLVSKVPISDTVPFLYPSPDSMTIVYSPPYLTLLFGHASVAPRATFTNNDAMTYKASLGPTAEMCEEIIMVQVDLQIIL